MAPRKRVSAIEEFVIEARAIGVIEKGVPIFLRNRREHPAHDRETCFQETIEELRAQYTAAETETRRSSGD